MRHVRIIVALGLTAAALTVGPIAARQQPKGEPFSTAITKLKDGLYVIPGYDGAVTGGNVAVRVTSEGVIIVDDKFPPASTEIVPKVRSVTSQPIKYVLSTHNHGDHTGGHPEFIKTAEIIAHRNARENMVKGKQAAPPRIVFNDQADLFLGGVEVQARYMGRGHTNGDSVIYFRDLRTVHTGDLVVWGKRTDGTVLTPFMDYSNGGSLTEWIATLEKVLQLDFDAAIPGHGPVLTKDDVRAFRQKLVTLRQRAADLIQSRVSRNDFMGKLKIDDLNWPFPKERIEALYDELTAPAQD
jgi:glyoxylase-like metal-dependent hydrolase (beta-lactamase superfamily II)